MYTGDFVNGVAHGEGVILYKQNEGQQENANLSEMDMGSTKIRYKGQFYQG